MIAIARQKAPSIAFEVADVTAGMIATAGDIEVTNPDLLICHLDEGATLNMELIADIGKGYVPAQANRPVDAPIGLIPVDALYSPVRQVAYKVDNARIGQELDYDKLTITVETDGTISPDDALVEPDLDLPGRKHAHIRVRQRSPVCRRPRAARLGAADRHLS